MPPVSALAPVAPTTPARGPADPGGLAIASAGRWLIVRFPDPVRLLSWAVIGGGATVGSAVVWRQVDGAELGPDVDAERWLRHRLTRLGLGDAVGMLTARRVDVHDDVTACIDGVRARCIATVGLGNAVRVGDPPGPLERGGARPIGTINLLCAVTTPLTAAAELEVLSVAVQARTTAILEAGVASARTGARASGTGTDCVVIASGLGEQNAAAYAGTHTALGAAVGAAVHEAVRRGAARWRAEYYP